MAVLLLLAVTSLVGLTSCSELAGALEAYDQAYVQQQTQDGTVSPPTTAPIPLDRQAVIDQCGFSEGVLIWVEQTTGNPPQPFFDIDGRLQGVQVAMAEEEVTRLMEGLETSKPDDYLAFRSEANSGYGPDKVAFIKTADQYDILRVSQTTGVVYDAEGAPATDVSTETVIAQLEGWDERYGIVITGAGYNWVEARLETPPDRLYSFAHEVYEFCPDIVDYWMGSVQALANDLHETQTLYLWWD